MAASDRATLASLKACSMSGHQSSCQCLGPPPFVASDSGLRMLAAPLMSLLSKLIIPKKLSSWEHVVGRGYLRMAYTLAGSGLIPLLSTRWPRNSTWDLWNWNFSPLMTRPCFSSTSITRFTSFLCSAAMGEATRMSSM